MFMSYANLFCVCLWNIHICICFVLSLETWAEISTFAIYSAILSAAMMSSLLLTRRNYPEAGLRDSFGLRNQRMNAPEDRGCFLNCWCWDNLVGQMRGKQVLLAGGNIISQSGSVLSLMGSQKRVPILQ